jgi:putative two-component system response regulator
MTTAQKLSILIVDDEPQLRALLSEMLSDLGHRVAAVANPQEARDAVRGASFDLVFADQYLGSALGLDLMQDLLTLDSNLYFIMMTGNGTTDLAVEAMQRGASDFLVKPFFEEDVIRSIAYVLKKRDLHQERACLVRELETRVAEQTTELINVNFSVLAALARAVETKDLGTYGHSMRVSRYAEKIAERLGLPQRDRDDLHAASLLHDIGKIGISDAILGKISSLSRDEMAMVRKHPENGVAILRPLTYYGNILPAILHHHEHLDGSGYPSGIAGTTIPLLARIISVADTYDAIVSDRPYRKGATEDEALAELQRMAGKQFDADVVDVFAGVLEKDQRPLQTGRTMGAMHPGCPGNEHGGFATAGPYSP